MKKLYIILIILIIANFNIYAVNLVENGDFSKLENELPANWTFGNYNNDKTTVFSYSDDEGALKISSSTDNHSYVLQNVEVTPKKNYKFSGKIKAENIPDKENGALLGIYYTTTYSNEVRGSTNDYVNAELYFTSDTKTVPIMLSLGGYGRMNFGTAYFKDIQIEEVDSVPDGAHFCKYSGKTSENNSKKTSDNFDYRWTVLIILFICVLIASFYFTFKKSK